MILERRWVMNFFAVQGSKPSATSAIKTEGLAENPSSVKFIQRKRIKGKFESSFMSVGAVSVTVDAERDENAEERRKTSVATPALLAVDESGVNTNTRRHVIISSKHCPVAPSQGPLAFQHDYDKFSVSVSGRMKCCI